MLIVTAYNKRSYKKFLTFAIPLPSRFFSYLRFLTTTICL